jgi:hypothetical protein
MVEEAKIFEFGSVSNVTKLNVKTTKVIPASKTNFNNKKVQVIGGDSEDFQQETPPSIIIEKDNDRIARIIVKCPCGRHSELVCEYDDDESVESLPAPPEQSEAQDV